MLLRCNRRVKDGKAHEYWKVAENRRLSDWRIVQRQVLYLGEINASQREAWRKTICRRRSHRPAARWWTQKNFVSARRGAARRQDQATAAANM